MSQMGHRNGPKCERHIRSLVKDCGTPPILCGFSIPLRISRLSREIGVEQPLPFLPQELQHPEAGGVHRVGRHAEIASDGSGRFAADHGPLEYRTTLFAQPRSHQIDQRLRDVPVMFAIPESTQRRSRDLQVDAARRESPSGRLPWDVASPYPNACAAET